MGVNLGPYYKTSPPTTSYKIGDLGYCDNSLPKNSELICNKPTYIAEIKFVGYSRISNYPLFRIENVYVFRERFGDIIENKYALTRIFNKYSIIVSENPHNPKFKISDRNSIKVTGKPKIVVPVENYNNTTSNNEPIIMEIDVQNINSDHYVTGQSYWGIHSKSLQRANQEIFEYVGYMNSEGGKLSKDDLEFEFRKYALKGDVENSERMLERIKQWNFDNDIIKEKVNPFKKLFLLLMMPFLLFFNLFKKKL